MNPSWSGAPEGATHLAMDGDGWWFWWFCEPYWDSTHDQWVAPEDPNADEDDIVAIPAADMPDCSGEIDWDHASDTLECRP